MNINTKAYIPGIFLALIFLYSCLYTVNEGERAILLRLGSIETNGHGATIIVLPGLHFKWPLINQVHKFDVRLQTLDITSSRIVTIEKKNVIVDYYVKWRISDLALFYTRSSGNSTQAETLLKQQLNAALRTEFGRHTINEVIADDRANIMDKLQRVANADAQGYGINVIDVRIKRIDLPEEVSQAIFDQMRAEREKAAGEHRAMGKAAAEAIRANADAHAAITISTAKADAARIRGEGDLQAAKIYADAYAKDAEFYAFYRSLIAYRNAFATKKDVLIIKPDSQFFRYFKGNQSAKTNK